MLQYCTVLFFFFSSRRRHTRSDRDWSSDVCSSDLGAELEEMPGDGFDVEPIWRAINHTVWRTRFEKLAAEHRDELSETFLKQLALAQRTSGTDYQQAMFDRTILFRRVQSMLQRADLLVMPTISRTALPI